MKKRVEVEKTFCDFCGRPADYATECMGCGVAICYDCEAVNFVKYPHSLYSGGHGDGHYCKNCDDKLSKAGDPLILAYRKLLALRRKQDGAYLEFKRRGEVLEQTIKKLIAGRKSNDNRATGE